jgi:hypothetical protein
MYFFLKKLRKLHQNWTVQTCESMLVKINTEPINCKEMLVSNENLKFVSVLSQSEQVWFFTRPVPLLPTTSYVPSQNDGR